MPPLPGLFSLLRRRCIRIPNKALISFFLPHFSSAVAGDGATGYCVVPSPQPDFMVEFLISRCGLSQEKASSAAPVLRGIKTLERPNSVLNFLKGFGFDGPEIKKLVISNLRLLVLDVEKRLAPNFQALVDIGFSGAQVRQIALSNSWALNQNVKCKVVPRIELWRRLLGSDEVLYKHLSRKKWLISYNSEKRILPNLEILRECGISDEMLLTILRVHPLVIVQKPATLKASLEYLEGLGMSRSSKTLLRAVDAMHMVGNDGFKTKMQIMMSLGWSESQFLTAFRKAPYLLPLSQGGLRRKMEFLVHELGCDPSYVSQNPALLMYSLEKRLSFRHSVLKILKSRGLHCGDYSPYSVMSMSEQKFLQKYILPYENVVLELHQLYVKICKQDTSLL